MKNKKKKILKWVVVVILILALNFILKLIIDAIDYYKPIEKVDYSQYNFVGSSWSGKDGDLYFGEDGEFYFGFDGESEDYYDLCERYTYNDSSKTIKLKCAPYFLGSKKIKLLEVNDHFIKIRFKNKTSIYIKEIEYECKYEYEEGCECESEEECSCEYVGDCKYEHDFINSWEMVDENGKYFLGLEETGMINYFYIDKVDAEVYDPSNILNDEYGEDGPIDDYVDYYDVKKHNRRVCNGNGYDFYEINYSSKFYEFYCDIDNWKKRRYRYYYDETDNSINVVKGKKIEKLLIKSSSNETLKIKIDGKVREFTKEEN